MVVNRNAALSIRRFLFELKKEIRIERVILFGSYAQGKPHRFSDIDIAVISADFQRFAPVERLALLGKVAWRVKATEIEALGFTSEEYKRTNRFDFLYEIKRKGKVLTV